MHTNNQYRKSEVGDYPQLEDREGKLLERQKLMSNFIKTEEESIK